MSGPLESGAAAVSAWIASCALPVAVLGGIALLVDALGHRLPLPLRTAAWLAVLARACVPPGSASVFPAVMLPLPGAQIATESGSQLVIALVWGGGVAALALTAALTHRRRLARWRLGAMACLPAELAELVERCAERFGFRRAPLVLLSPTAPSPLVHGIFQPALLLPASFGGANHGVRTEHVVLHEFAHVRHRDPLAAAVLLCVAILCWWHPLVWIGLVRLANLREFRADRAAASLAEGGASGYRRTLLEHARPLLGLPFVSTLAPRLGSSVVLARVRLLETGSRPPRAGECTFSAALFVALVLGTGSPAAPQGTSDLDVPPDPFQQDGCLRRRFLVLAQMHRHLAASSGSNHPISRDRNP